jgi:hypothetical protein
MKKLAAATLVCSLVLAWMTVPSALGEECRISTPCSTSPCDGVSKCQQVDTLGSFVPCSTPLPGDGIYAPGDRECGRVWSSVPILGCVILHDLDCGGSHASDLGDCTA